MPPFGRSSAAARRDLVASTLNLSEVHSRLPTKTLTTPVPYPVIQVGC